MKGHGEGRAWRLRQALPALCLISALALLAACGPASGGGGWAERGLTLGFGPKPAVQPTSWVQHRSGRGFRISTPKGWAVAVSSGGVITARSGATQVLAQPFLLGQQESSETWLRHAPRRLASFLPQARLEAVTGVGDPQGEAVAKLAYRAGHSTGKATLLCAMWGRAGMVYGIAGPAATFDRDKGELTTVLDTLRFERPTSPVRMNAASGGGAPIELRYVRWHDPREDAFTTEIPAGWRAQGGLIRRNALDPRQTAVVTPPDNSALLVYGDAGVPGCILPSPMLSAAGIGIGRVYNTGAVSYLVEPFWSGSTFAVRWLKQRVTSPYSDLRLMQERNRPDIAQPIENYLNEMGQGVFHYRASEGEVPFTCRKGGQTWHGICFGLTVLMSSGGFNVWAGYPVGYVAAPGREGVAFAALKHMVQTWRVNPNWVAQQSRIAMRVSQIFERTNEQISRDIDDAYWSRQKVLDTTNRHFDNYILGVTDVRDPETGRTWSVAAGHNYYWLQGGTAHTGDSPPPDVDLNRLKEY